MSRRSWLPWLMCSSICACVDSRAARESLGAGDRWDGALPSALNEAGAACDIFVADPLIEHSCFHAMVGPYRERDFREASGLLEVNRAHTAFLLSLPARGQGYEATMLYDARAAGGYAFFSSPHVTLSVVQAEEAHPLTSFAGHETEICPELPWVEAFQLPAGRHELRVKSPVPEAMLVVEFMDEGAPEYSYRTACPLPARPDAGDSFEEGGAPDGASDAGRDGAMPEHDAATDADGGCWVDPVLEHSCLHVSHGPYVTVTAASTGATAPNVNAPHTSYTVELPSTEGLITYRPAESGEYVFYLGSAVGLSLEVGGSSLSPTHEEPAIGCTGLQRAFVYPLSGTTKYELTLRANGPATSATLVVEHIAGLTSVGWENRLEACE